MLILGFYLWSKDKSESGETGTKWYQNFNPFGLGKKVTNIGTVGTTDENGNIITEEGEEVSRFEQITDFAVSGATFLYDNRLREGDSVNTPEPVEIKTIVSAGTIEGRKEIQNILNKTLSLKPQLTIDGVLGKSAIEAIKKFQELNNIPVTGKVDEKTAPYFTKTTKELENLEQTKYESVPSIRYVERKNGHIYKMFLDTKNKDKISNSTIPSIYEALFNATGNTVIYRYLSTDNTINSFMATLGKPRGEYLPENITDASVSLDKTKFFYLTESSTGVVGTIGTFGNTKRDIVFSSPFTEWLSDWDSSQRVYLTTKASYAAQGSVFLLNEANKTITKILGGIWGLTTKISPNGEFVLYSTNTETGPRLSIFNIKENSSKDLDTYGLAEKCVWSKNSVNVYCAVPNVIEGSAYPDSWYQGLVSFDDYFVRINANSQGRETLANSINETPVDGTYLFLDKAESSLFFINKKDLTLWKLRLN